MRTLWITLATAALACNPPADEQSIPQPIAAAETAPAAAPADSTLYLDVRTPEEYQQGHVKGALLIPYDQLEKRWQEIEGWREKPVVLYCRSGRRAGIALDVLKARGFTRATNGGGMDQMRALGLTITTGE